MDKKDIRKLITEKKRLLTPEETGRRSSALALKLYELPEYKNADKIFIYLSFNQEVQTDPIIKQAFLEGRKVAVPRIISADSEGNKLPLDKQYMEFIYIDENTVYREYKGIREPAEGSIADPDDLTLVIVPGLAFGRDMTRIGYGGGFYDRYFAAHRNCGMIKAALSYDFQVFDTLPVQPHDEKIDILITDAK